MRDVTAVPPNNATIIFQTDGLYQGVNTHRPTNAPANQYTIDQTLLSGAAAAAAATSSERRQPHHSLYQRGQPLQPMHVLTNYTK